MGKETKRVSDFEVLKKAMTEIPASPLWRIALGTGIVVELVVEKITEIAARVVDAKYPKDEN